MFQIKFDTKKAVWVIQISSLFGIVWSKVSNAEFLTLEEAEDYVQRVGLSRAYRQHLTVEPEWAAPHQMTYPQVLRSQRAI